MLYEKSPDSAVRIAVLCGVPRDFADKYLISRGIESWDGAGDSFFAKPFQLAQGIILWYATLNDLGMRWWRESKFHALKRADQIEIESKFMRRVYRSDPLNGHFAVNVWRVRLSFQNPFLKSRWSVFVRYESIVPRYIEAGSPAKFTPTLFDVLHDLLPDTRLGRKSFEDYGAEVWGDDADSPRSRRAYKLIRRNTLALNKLLAHWNVDKLRDGGI